jgi:hypothetical protein
MIGSDALRSGKDGDHRLTAALGPHPTIGSAAKEGDHGNRGWGPVTIRDGHRVSRDGCIFLHRTFFRLPTDVVFKPLPKKTICKEFHGHRDNRERTQL